MRPDRDLIGWAALRCTGPDPAGFLTRLAEQNVPFWDAEPPADFSVSFRVPTWQVKRVRRMAERAGFEVAALSRHGLPAVLSHLRGRWLPAVLLAALAFLILWSEARIWRIDIEGNDRVPEGVLRQALAECGVDIGSRWVDMSQDAVRNGVILRLPDIRWMTVTMEGSAARVIVRETRERLDPIPEDEYANIVSDRTGLVTAVYALHGTAEVEPGDAVLPGETLVGGYATGRFGVQGPVRAVGYADLRTWYEITAAAPSEVTEKRPTGEKRTVFSLVFGDTRINFYKGSSICPPECDKISVSMPLELSGVLTLPIALERTTVTAYAVESVSSPELSEELSASLLAELSKRLGDDGEIVSAEFSAWEAEGMLYVTLQAECRERVGVPVPMTEAELAAVYEKIPQTEE